MSVSFVAPAIVPCARLRRSKPYERRTDNKPFFTTAILIVSFAFYKEDSLGQKQEKEKNARVGLPCGDKQKNAQN